MFGHTLKPAPVLVLALLSLIAGACSSGESSVAETGPISCNRAGVYRGGTLIAPADPVFGDPDFGALRDACPGDRGTGAPATGEEYGYWARCSGHCCTYADPIRNAAGLALAQAGYSSCFGSTGLDPGDTFSATSGLCAGDVCVGVLRLYYCAPSCSGAALCPAGFFCAASSDVPGAPAAAGRCIAEALRETALSGRLPEEPIPPPSSAPCPSL